MQIVINLPKYVIGLCCEDNVTAPVDIATLIHAVKVGTPLPKGHGDLIDRDDLLADSYCIDDWGGNEVNIVDVMTVKMADAIIESDKAERESKE